MFYVAVARAKTRDAAGAQAAALEVKRLTPGGSLGYHAAGFVAIELGHWVDAEREYRSALRLAPTSADFLNNLGLAVLRQGRTHEATELFTQAGALEPTSERLRNNTRAAARAPHVDPRCGATPVQRRAAGCGWRAGSSCCRS